MSKEPNRNVYVGHRYVPKIMGEWDNSIDYEGLSIVTYQGASYTSKKRVPVGIDILNDEFWVVTGNYNAQVDYYRDETERVANDLLLKADKSYTDTELGKKADKSYTDTELDKKTDQSYTDNELDKKSDKENYSVNVKDFGAKGDGVTDDTLAFQNALDTKRNVYIPETEQSYVISSTLKYYTRQKVYGSGDKSLIKSEVIGEPIFTNGEVHTQVTIQYFRINGNGMEKNGIEFLNGYEHMYMNNITMVGVGGNSIHLINTYGLYMHNLHLFGTSPEDEVTSTNRNGVYSNGSNGCVITGSLIKHYQTGLNLIWSYNFNVKDSLIEGNNGNGIYLEKPNQCSFKDLYFEGNGRLLEPGMSDIYIGYDESDSYPIFEGLKIEDCYFRSNFVYHTIKIDAILRNSTISNLQITGFEKTYQHYKYDINIRNNERDINGHLYTDKINMDDLNDNGTGEYIRVLNDLNPFKLTNDIKLHYMDGETGTTVAGEIPCTIFARYVRKGETVLYTFEISDIDLTNIPDYRIFRMDLPIPMSHFTGHMTSPVYIKGKNPLVTGVLCYVSPTMNGLNFQRIGVESDNTTRFDTRYLEGITSLSSSIEYFI